MSLEREEIEALVSCFQSFVYLVNIHCHWYLYPQQQEFEWLLHEEVNVILNQLHNLIVVSDPLTFPCLTHRKFPNKHRNFCFHVGQECCRRFPVRVPGLETLVKPEKYQLQFQQAAGSGSNTSGSGATGQGSGGTGSGQPHGSHSSHQDQVKITATLQGDNISHAVCS